MKKTSGRVGWDSRWGYRDGVRVPCSCSGWRMSWTYAGQCRLCGEQRHVAIHTRNRKQKKFAEILPKKMHACCSREERTSWPNGAGKLLC